jgi:hypothetical protein
MRGYRIGAVLLAAFAWLPIGAQAGQPSTLLAQAGSKLNPEDQLAPSQMAQPMPGAVAEPTKKSRKAPQSAAAAAKPAAPAKPTPAAPPERSAAAANMHAVACTGAFSKDSSNLRLAMTFDSKNVTFADEDVDGSKVGASILFAKDPKRRLEVWWSNPNRSSTYLILINGKSTWSAPGGMRLGLTLAELEKLNHKAFKVKGFNKDRIASVSDWDGGVLATLAGGCKSGVSMQADPKAAPDAVTALPADKEFSSDDPSLRELKPTVSEILLGY